MPFKTDVTQMFRELGHDRTAWTRPIPITYEGEAAAWPHPLARHDGKPRRFGPEASHFLLDRSDEIRFDEQWGISEPSIWFEDGFSMRLAAIRPSSAPIHNGRAAGV